MAGQPSHTLDPAPATSIPRGGKPSQSGRATTPRNLLKAHFTESDLAKILASVPRRPLLPTIGAKEWRDAASNPIVKKWMEPIAQLAEKELGLPMNLLTDEIYREFYTKGTRLSFETIFFDRRRILSRAAICALLSDGAERKKWIESLTEKLIELDSEFSWAAPAHVNSPSGRDAHRIDIFAAETASLVAEILDIFSAVLPEDFVTRMKWRLGNQYFDNYLNRHLDFWWVKSPNNWNAVCHQGVVGVALAIEEDPEKLARMLLLMSKYLPNFLGGFGSDGGCAEGPAHWQFGFGAFCVLNEELEVRSGGQLSLIEDDVQVREIAKYGPRVSLSNFHLVNFGDAPRTGALNPQLLAYLGTRFDDESCRAHADRCYQRLVETGINLQSQKCDLRYLSRVFLSCPRDVSKEIPTTIEGVFLHDLGIVISRSKDRKGNLWEFAAKAGNNTEPQNHNDCGSYILNINGVPIVTEIGAPEFRKDYFGEKRYQFLASRTSGHSLPISNGSEQVAGPRHVSSVISREIDANHVLFSVELTNCYPSTAHCTEIVRGFELDKRKGILRVKDFYDLSKQDSFETAVMTDFDAVIKGAVAILKTPFGDVFIRPADDTILVGTEELDYRDSGGVSRKIYRVTMRPADLATQRVVTYDIELGE